jgi:hypothetical protein
MKKMLGVGTVALALCIGVGQSRGQYPGAPFGPGGQAAGPFARPVVSPYLNLVRPGASPGFNYATLVRPQQQFYSGMQQLGLQNTALQQNLTGFEATAFQPITGQRAQFMNYSRYFLNTFAAQPTGYRSPFTSALNTNRPATSAGGTGGAGGVGGAARPTVPR